MGSVVRGGKEEGAVRLAIGWPGLELLSAAAKIDCPRSRIYVSSPLSRPHWQPDQ